MARSLVSRKPANWLLALPDDDLRAALAAADPVSGLELLAAAPTFADQSRLLRCLPVRTRIQVLDRLPAPVVAALVQNLESENAYLLGQLSAERFRDLLALGSPGQQLYWLQLATSEPTARSFAFPLSVPAEDLARALLSEPAFAQHVRATADFPVWDLRLPPEAMGDPLAALLTVYGVDGLLREFPLPAGPSRQVVAAILEQHSEHYLDVVRAALRQLDYAAAHPEEEDALAEEPVMLGAGAIEPASVPPDVEEAPGPEVRLPIPVLALMVPTGPGKALTPERRAVLAAELHVYLLREAVAAGGSFLAGDLETIAGRLVALAQLGAALAGAAGPEGLARALSRHSASALIDAGSREVERLRQVAIRLRPLRHALDRSQRGLVGSLIAPRVVLDAARQPALEVIGPGGVAAVLVAEVRARLQRAAAWAELARTLTFRRTADALRQAGDSAAVAAGIGLGAVLYGRVEFGLAEPDDLRAFSRRYLSARTRRLLPRASSALRRAVEPFAAERRAPAQALLAALEAGLDHLAQAFQANPDDPEALVRACYLGQPVETVASSDVEEEEDAVLLSNEP